MRVFGRRHLNPIQSQDSLLSRFKTKVTKMYANIVNKCTSNTKFAQERLMPLGGGQQKLINTLKREDTTGGDGY